VFCGQLTHRQRKCHLKYFLRGFVNYQSSLTIGATTLRIMTLCIMTLCMTIFSIKAISIMYSRVMLKIIVFLYFYAECHYAVSLC
jgi:hypothetical protein